MANGRAGSLDESYELPEHLYSILLLSLYSSCLELALHVFMRLNKSRGKIAK